MAKFNSREVDALQNGGNQSPRIHEDDTRKPGSDKVCYEGKISSIIFSPGSFSKHSYDDRFANEGSGPRISDFSMSNGGEQIKTDVQHSGTCSSEDVWSHAINMFLETNSKRDADGIHRLQYFFSPRTTSLGSTDSNLSYLRSYSSGGLVDFFSEPFQASGPHQNKVSCTPQPFDLGSTVSSDLSEAPVAPKQFSSFALSIGLFQFPAAPSQASSVDLFQSSALSAIPSFNELQPVKAFQSSSVDFMDLSQQPSAAMPNEKSLELSVPKNEGWATFDTPQHTTSTGQPWNAFKYSATSVPVDALNQGLQMHDLPSTDDQFFDLRASKCQLQFLDVSTLQAALPDSQLSPTFQSGIAEPWLPQNTLNPYVSSAGQDGFLSANFERKESWPLAGPENIQTNGPVASVGGNPFA
ncbi:putative ADP-ribosylation factor GTPase-activating protein AGD14 isoform B [Glycine soja]|uniref:Putative ADP-ribosylation factor GTPase-activating protein AGD14 isoform A n=2 Tax=Glycine soja TaxID=3848 RepID=A0A445FFF4_GLYSO|nr:putative ADP-ribosylation factor GTPase-activating protein AGD14 isoform A [Glycine soja]RZB47540.1 putative ADP-ribosylation factor GTPase-activating protein AGD14 isoform B [Glycine soja]